MVQYFNGGGDTEGQGVGSNPGQTGFQGAVTLTLDQIRTELGLLNDQVAEKYPDATADELTALQQQAYAEFIEMAQADGGVNITPTLFAQALNQPYDQDFQNLYYSGIGNKTPLGLGYSQTVTAGTDAYNTWLQDNPDAGVAQSVFGTGTAAKSWVPEAITQAGVQAPTDYEQMTAAQMAPYLPTAPYDVTKIAQDTPAYTAAGTLPIDLFDPINFPQNVITRGTPVISRGFDALGRPNTAITMGQSAATPTGPNIGNLTTTTQFPSTGMGIGPTGLGTTTVGTMGTTGNIVSTGADNLVTWVDENGVLQTSSIDPNVINTGSGTNTGVTVTPSEVDLSKVPGSMAFCEINPTHDSCIPGTAAFCTINPNHASCQSGDSCPVGTARAGSSIPNGKTPAWCDEDNVECGPYQTYDALNNACITKSAQQVIGDLYLAEEAALGANAALADRQAAARRVGDAIAVYGAATDQAFTSTQLTEWLNPFVGTGGTGYSADTGLSTGIAIEVDDPNTLIDESKVSEYEASKWLLANPIAGVTGAMDAAEIAAWDAYFGGTGPLPATTAGQATAGGVDWPGADTSGTVVDTTGGAGADTVTTAVTTDTLVDPGVAGTALTGAGGTDTVTTTDTVTDTTGGTTDTVTTADTTTVVDPYALQKATCSTNGGTWDGVNNICVPAIDTTAITNQVNAQLGGIGGLYPGVGVVGAKTPGGPALPTNLETSVVPGIDSVYFGDGQLTGGGGFGFAANTAAGAGGFGGPFAGTQFAGEGGGGHFFNYGGEVEGKEDKSNQRQNAVGSRLMRHAGLGQYRDMIPPEMLSSLDRIMDRKG